MISIGVACLAVSPDDPTLLLGVPRRILSLIQSRVSGTTFRPKRRATGFCAAAHYVYTTLANHSKRLADNLANSA
jgi:hypothetical protein